MSSLTETDVSGLAADHVKHVERLWRTVKSIQATEVPETLLGVAKRDYRDLTRALYVVKAARLGRQHRLHLRSHEERMALEAEWEDAVAALLDALQGGLDVAAAWHEAHRGWVAPEDPPDGMVVGYVGPAEALVGGIRKAIGTKPKKADFDEVERWGGQRGALARKILESGEARVLRHGDGVAYAVVGVEQTAHSTTITGLVTSPEAVSHTQDALREIAIEAAAHKSSLTVHPANKAQTDYFSRLGMVRAALPAAPGTAAGAGAAGAATAFTPAGEEAMLWTVDAVTQYIQQGGVFPQSRAAVQAALASSINQAATEKGAFTRYLGLATKTAEQAGQLSLDQLGLNKTFAFANPQNMASDLFAVRGSKVVQGMYGEHLRRLTDIIVEATAPRSPLSIPEVTKRIRDEWPKLTKYQAVRIARTETAAVWMHTAMNAYAANGISEWESIVAKGPSIEVDAQGACGFCTEMASHTHSMDDVHVPPYHPHCRCDVVPVLEDPHTGEPWLPPDEPWVGGGEIPVVQGPLGFQKLVPSAEPSVPLGGPLAWTTHAAPKPAERAALRADVDAWPSFTPSGADAAPIKVVAQEMVASPLPIKAMRTPLGNTVGVATYEDGFMLPNSGHTILVHRIETATGDRYAMLRDFAQDAYRGKVDYLAIDSQWLPVATVKRLREMGFERLDYQPNIMHLRGSDLPERFGFDPTDVVSPVPTYVPPPVTAAPPLVKPLPPPPPKIDFEEVTDVAAFNAKIATSPYKDFITVHSPEEVKAAGTRLFLSKDGNVTFSVTRSGDIQNVVALPAAPKGAGGVAVEEAIRRGGTHLDAYDGFLPGFYEKHGFRITGRMRWVDEYAPEGWDYAKFQRPDVVFMSYAKPGADANVAAQVLFKDWDAAKGWSRALGQGARLEEARAEAFAESAVAKLVDERRFALDSLGASPDNLQRYRVTLADSEVVFDEAPGVLGLSEYFRANLVHVQAKGKLKDRLFFQAWTDDAGRVHMSVGTSFRQVKTAEAFASVNDSLILDAKVGWLPAKKLDVGPAMPEPIPAETLAKIHEKGLDRWPPFKGAKATEILGDQSDTVALYTKGGAWAQEREALHKDIVERHFEGKLQPTGETPTAYFTSGGGASGKSGSIFRVGDQDVTLHDMKLRDDVVVIDPDAIKTMLPEYQEMIKAGDAYASFAVHEESKALARAVKEIAQKRGFNVVIDTTGSGNAFVGKLESFKKAGYVVKVSMSSVPTREAIVRSVKRGEQTGRYVAVHALARAHREASRALTEWEAASYVDEWRVYDNTAGRVLVAEKRIGGEKVVYDQERLSAIEHKAGEPHPDLALPVPEAPARPANQPFAPIKLDEPEKPLTPDGFQNSTPAEADDAIKVYVAESDIRAKFGPGNVFDEVQSTFEKQASAERYAQEVWERNKDLWAGSVTRPEYVYVREGVQPNHSELQYVTEGGATIYPRITLGDNMRDQLTILHEEAHAMFGPVLQHEVGHSPRFQEKFVQLLRREMPTLYSDGLELRLGLKVPYVPKPGFEPTAPPVEGWAWADGEVRRPVSPTYAPGHEDWVAGLSGSQRAAVESWTEGTEAVGINIDIRAGKLLTSAQQKQADALDRLVAAAPEFEEPVTVWRGVSLDGTFEGIDDAALETRLLKEFPVGSTLKPKGYQAASFGTDAPLDASMNKSNIGMVFEIRTRRGAVLRDLSKYDDEDELLLSRGEVWEVRRITRETFERWEDGKQLERYVVHVEARDPDLPVGVSPQKLSSEPFENNVVTMKEGVGIGPERADWLRSEAEKWTSPGQRDAASKVVDAAENPYAIEAPSRLIELRDEYQRLRGVASVFDNEGDSFVKSSLDVTDLVPDSGSNVLAIKQMISTAASLARGHVGSVRINPSRIMLAGDEWDEIRLWARERGFAVGAVDDVWWSAKTDDLVTTMRLDEVKQPQFEVPLPPKATTMTPEVIGGLHVEVAGWPGAKGAKELLQRAAQDKKMSLKVIRDEDGALESLAASKTVTDLSGKPLMTAEVYTSTGEPLVDIIPSLVDDAQMAGARLEIVSNEVLTSDTLTALGMKRVESTKRWYANQNDLDVVRLRAEAADGNPLFGVTPKPVPGAAPTAMPIHEGKYVAEDFGTGTKQITEDATVKLNAETNAAFADVQTRSMVTNMLVSAKNSYSKIIVVRDEHGIVAGIARYSDDVPNGIFRVDSFYTIGSRGADDRLFNALASKMTASPRDTMAVNTYQVRASEGFLDDLRLKGFDEDPAASYGGTLEMSKDDVAATFKDEPVSPPILAGPPPAPLEVLQLGDMSGDPLTLGSLRDEVEQWSDWKRASTTLDQVEQFPLALATIRTGDGKLDGIVAWNEWVDMKRVGVVDNLIMRNSDDLDSTERLLAVVARRAFDRDWKMTIQSIDASGLPTIDYGLQQRLVSRGAKEVDAGASGKYLEVDSQDLAAVFALDDAKFTLNVGAPKLGPTKPISAEEIVAPGDAEILGFTDVPLSTDVSSKAVERMGTWIDLDAKKRGLDQLGFALNQDGVGLLQVRSGESLQALATYSYSDNALVVHGLTDAWKLDLADPAVVQVALAADLRAVFGLAKMASAPPRALVLDVTADVRPELVQALEAMGFTKNQGLAYLPSGKLGISWNTMQETKMLDDVVLPPAALGVRPSATAGERPPIPPPRDDVKLAERVGEGDVAPVTPGGTTKEAGTAKMNKDLSEGMREHGVEGLKADVMERLDARLRDNPAWQPDEVRAVYGMSMNRWSSDASKDVTAQLVNNWAITSSDANWRGVAIQIAAKEELGLGDVRAFAASFWRIADEEKNLRVVQEAMDKLRDNPHLRSSLRAFVRAQYDETQEYLKGLGVDEVTIYRGLSVSVDDPAVPWKNGLSVTPATDNPISSWSFRHNVARRSHFFGGTMLRASVPREMIFSFPRTGFGCADEWEVLVVNTGHNRVWVSQSGEIPLDREALERLTTEKTRLQAESAALHARYDTLGAMDHGAGPRYGSPERTEMYELRERFYPVDARITKIDRGLERGSMRYDYDKESELRAQIDEALRENPALAGKAIRPTGWTTAQWKAAGRLREEIEVLDRKIHAAAQDVADLHAFETTRLAKPKQANVEAAHMLLDDLAEKRSVAQAKLAELEERVAAKLAAKPTVTPEVAAAKKEITSLKRKITGRQKKIDEYIATKYNTPVSREGASTSIRVLLAEAFPEKQFISIHEQKAPFPTFEELRVAFERAFPGKPYARPYWFNEAARLEGQIATYRTKLEAAQQRLADAQAAAVAKARYTSSMRRLRRRVGL